MVNQWRKAGLTYLRYSQICANVVRNSLKKEHQEGAAGRAVVTTITARNWDAGKPIGKHVPVAEN